MPIYKLKKSASNLGMRTIRAMKRTDLGKSTLEYSKVLLQHVNGETVENYVARILDAQVEILNRHIYIRLQVSSDRAARYVISCV
jgi:hypothetical protein